MRISVLSFDLSPSLRNPLVDVALLLLLLEHLEHGGVQLRCQFGILKQCLALSFRLAEEELVVSLIFLLDSLDLLQELRVLKEVGVLQKHLLDLNLELRVVMKLLLLELELLKADVGSELLFCHLLLVLR